VCTGEEIAYGSTAKADFLRLEVPELASRIKDASRRQSSVPTASLTRPAISDELVAVGTKGVPTINPNASGAGRTKGDGLRFGRPPRGMADAENTDGVLHNLVADNVRVRCDQLAQIRAWNPAAPEGEILQAIPCRKQSFG